MRTASIQNQIYQKNTRFPTKRLGQKRLHRYQNDNTKVKKLYRPLVLILIFTLSLSAIFYLLFTLLSVKQIFCTDSENTSCPPELLQTLNQFQNRPLLFLKIDNPTQFIKDFQQFDQLSWEKKYPNTLYFTVHKSPPTYILTNENSYYLVLRSGKVTKIDQATDNLPSIIFAPIAQLETISIMNQDTHQSILELLQLLPEFKINFEIIEWRSEYEILIKTKEKKNIFIRSLGLQNQLEKVKTIIDRQSELPAWNEIDVRFQHAVVR